MPWLLALSGLWGMVSSLPGQAASPATLPPEVATVINQVEIAANQRDLKGVLKFYSPQFQQADGLNRQMLEKSLSQLWQRYANLKYSTEVQSWEQDGNGVQVELVTRLTGTQTIGDRTFKLESVLRSRQHLENQKIVRQEILAERSQATSGTKPPQVKFNLPETVKPGQKFTFDAIVEEPLGEDLLLGAALEEPVKPEGLLNPTTANLEPLSAGGIFKMGTAPLRPEHQWISAVIVRHDGMTLITQRLRVIR